MSFSIKPNFFCIFKIGDNINYNLETLNYLYDLYNDVENHKKDLLLKPIITINICIIEAILFDFYKRVNTNIIEGVVNIDDDKLEDIRGKKIDNFAKYIDSAKKHDLFDIAHTNFYSKLHLLRSARNRIHIQNEKFFSPENECFVFTEEIKNLSERCLEFLVKTMNKKYERSEYLQGHVKEMFFPWKENFKKL